MEVAGPSPLSLAAVGLYLGVAVACWRASLRARAGRGWDGHSRAWSALGAAFVVLAAMRIFVAEELIRSALRGFLSSHDLYSVRRAIQAPLVIFFSAGAGAVLFVAIRGLAQANERSVRNLRIAQLAGLAMLALVGIRLISFGPIDHQLYGPLRLNWLIDIGAALAVAVSAIRYHAAAKDQLRR